MRKETVVLEDGRDVAAGRRYVVRAHTVEEEFTLVNRRVPPEHPQQRRLAAAGGTEQHDVAATGNSQVDLIDRRESLEPLGDAAQDDRALTTVRGDGIRGWGLLPRHDGRHCSPPMPGARFVPADLPVHDQGSRIRSDLTRAVRPV